MKTKISTIIALGLALTSSACLRVKPYERETLSKRAMTSDKDSGQSRFDQHAQGAREGATGGTGEAGGGCGCN